MAAASLREFCLALLQAPDLTTKLEPPAAEEGSDLPDDEPGPAVVLHAPVRGAGLVMNAGAPPLPPPGALGEATARAHCLARFAHHELMAAELFAWALLCWPDLPRPLRAGFASVLADEQRHCRLYLERLAAHSSRLEEHPLSDYFWKHVPAIAASPHGPRAFLCAMGLTLEQANLDFSILYRDAFRAAGDHESADVLDRVHADEIGHVRLAARWLLVLDTDAVSDLEAYERAVPFPLSAARAKGRRFEAAARRRAGLSEEFIEHVRGARSSQELAKR